MKSLLTALQEGRLSLFTISLATLGRFETEHVQRVINSDRPELLGLACAAVGIDKLPEDLRTCVILRDIEELTYAEIVDVLKIPEGTVKSRINRGRIELAKILRRMRVVTI